MRLLHLRKLSEWGYIKHKLTDLTVYVNYKLGYTLIPYPSPNPNSYPNPNWILLGLVLSLGLVLGLE